jgi:tetratricopeptide (TPR) repeat protein
MDFNTAKQIRDSVTSLFIQGRFDDGTHLLRQHEAGMPTAVRLECIGNLHFYRRELQQAILAYEAGIAVSPEHMMSRYQYLVGTRAEKDRNFVGAFKRYQAAIEIDREFVDAYVELGGLLVKVGDWRGAVHCYRDAARLAPADVGNLHNLRAVLAKLAETEPNVFDAELASADAAYSQARKEGKRPPQQHQW